MLRDVKVVFQDLDGCINTPDGTDLVSEEAGGLTREQERLLGEIGRAIDASAVEQVVLNTGRTHSAVGYVADAIGSRKIRYWLTEHAAHGYDATFLMALAIERGGPKRENIPTALRDVANPPGEIIRPGEWAKAKALLNEGKEINYEGASGDVDFDPNGDVGGLFGLNTVDDSGKWTKTLLK